MQHLQRIVVVKIVKSPKVSSGKTYMSPWLWHIETRGVVTPSDFLSEEERSSLNGPVVTYRLAPEHGSGEESHQMEKEESQDAAVLTREAMEALLKEGKSTSQMAKLFGVSRGTINNKKRQWGLVRPLRQFIESPAEEKKCGKVQMEVSDHMEASAAEQLLRNIAVFLQANGGTYEITLRVSKLR